MSPGGHFQRRGEMPDPRQGRARAEGMRGVKGAGIFRQIGSVVGVTLGVAALLVATAFLTSESSRLRTMTLCALAATVVVILLVQARRRRKRPSLDDVLPNRRQDSPAPRARCPHPNGRCRC